MVALIMETMERTADTHLSLRYLATDLWQTRRVAEMISATLCPKARLTVAGDQGTQQSRLEDLIDERSDLQKARLEDFSDSKWAQQKRALHAYVDAKIRDELTGAAALEYRSGQIRYRRHLPYRRSSRRRHERYSTPSSVRASSVERTSPGDYDSESGQTPLKHEQITTSTSCEPSRTGQRDCRHRSRGCNHP